jgi:hypothetical protein
MDADPSDGPLRTVGVRTTVIAVVLLWTMAMGMTAVLIAVTEHGFTYFAHDPASTLGAMPLVGAISHIGILLTWGAAIICLFVGAFLVRTLDRRAATPLLLLGAGTAYLAFDDLFLLHDHILSDYVGIAEKAVLVLYAVVAVTFFYWYRDFFREHELPLLASAWAALAVGYLLDFEQIHHLFTDDGVKQWFEESAKLLGLLLLAAYLVRLSARILTDAWHEARAQTSGEQG